MSIFEMAKIPLQKAIEKMDLDYSDLVDYYGAEGR